MTNEAQLRQFLTRTIPDEIQLSAIRPDGGSMISRDFGINVDAVSLWAMAGNAEGMTRRLIPVDAIRPCSAVHEVRS